VPANLSPEYKKAQDAFRAARDPQEKLDCLREMLRTIPKHKGTEHLQADIKSRMKELTEELGGPRRGGARGGPELAIRPEGAAQVALVGPPNAGKSTLHARLTGSHAVVGPYPFATKFPQPGMLPHEDVHFQLVDLPPVSAEHVEPWLGGTLQNADAVMLVVDLADPACVEQLGAVEQRLQEKKVDLVARVPGQADRVVAVAPGGTTDGGDGTAAAPVLDPATVDEALDDPFRRRVPALLVANKSDLFEDPDAELEVFRELAPDPFVSLAVSAETGRGLDLIGPALFDLLGVVRIYSKMPGHATDTSKPFTLRRGQTVRDVALQVHRGLAGELKFARVWGESADFDGQQVSGDHVVADRDVVELHW